MASEVIDDLIELDELADQEPDPRRRAQLRGLASRLARRAVGVKVSEAGEVLGLSAPTVRSWIDAGLLEPVAGSRPLRVSVDSLAALKAVVDAVRPHAKDQRLIGDAARMLRDRAILADRGVRAGLDDLAAGRVNPLSAERLDELVGPEPDK